MTKVQIILGIILVLLGIAMMKFPMPFIKILFSRIGPNNFKAYFGKDEGAKFGLYIAFIPLIIGVYIIYIGFLS